METTLFRDRLLERLRQDLIGPLTEDEVLQDRPTQRYSTGILYPQGSRIEAAEDEDGGLVVNAPEDAASSPEESGVALHAAHKPSVAGLSFAITPNPSQAPSIAFRVTCATYLQFAVDERGNEIEGKPANRRSERWRRVPLNSNVSMNFVRGESRLDLGEHGIDGLELYVLAVPHGEATTVTAAVSNKRSRGNSSAYDEQQHFFQVELEVERVSGGRFAPRPSRRAQTDEDSRVASLIYRDTCEYVVGHTCSARAVLNTDQTVERLVSDWLPYVRVPSVSDRGDPLFHHLAEMSEFRPLDADWLANAETDNLVGALNEIVGAYANWIRREEDRINKLEERFRRQAKRHVERCSLGEKRMSESIALIGHDSVVRRAFQLSQQAMATQYGWLRGGDRLVWRPFQIAFQLLVLASLADRTNQNRETMDLLWFPTGGGKTEAYLGLTAFAILLRRLRASAQDDGAGVSVLMRYTLRLLTIQQFQRAAAMICACELLRRHSQQTGESLGKRPIGIGLWVGASATPLNLKDARNRSPDNPSTPEQLTACPCCGGRLKWTYPTQGSLVTCSSPEGDCELAASGAQLPIWTIDEEVYRYTPSLLIGTVDKFAQIVRRPESGALFGLRTTYRPPDLIIQDELHLISGPLGSIAGIYEVAIDELCRRDGIRPKVIGSTATIRRAEDQIRGLFDRATYQFPAPGIDAINSGFAVTDPERPGRLYVGLTTAGRSATYMLQALVASLAQAACDPAASDEERDFYWTLVAYFNSLRELGRAVVLMQDDVPVSIRQIASRRSEEPRSVGSPAELTSRIRSYEIRDLLEQLTKKIGDPQAIDLLLASNMISVGVDIPRLGLMVVNSQPKTLSEYIQATSRVGRGSVPGVVITMYNAMRARDRSHFETFDTWHRSIYRDVEATSVTPFASRAQDKALHAVLVALARHTVPGMERQPMLDDLKRVEVEKLAALIENRVASVDPSEENAIHDKLASLIAEWASRDDLEAYWDDYGKKISLLMSAEQYAAKADVDPDLDPEGAQRAMWPTPNSMREVEPGVPFTLRHVLKAGD